MFIGDPKSGDRAAAFYTLIGNCHRAGIDAQAYLTDLFTPLPLPTETTKTLRGLTPQGWAAARKADAESPQASPTKFPSSQDQRGGVRRIHYNGAPDKYSLA